MYWIDPGTRRLLRQSATGGPHVFVADAGQDVAVQPRAFPGHLAWGAERVQVVPLDGGAGWQVGPGHSPNFVVAGRRMALFNTTRTELSVWDPVLGSHLSTAALVGGSALGFGAFDDVLVGDCLYRADDAGLELAVARLSADGGQLEPWGRASCPLGFLRDGTATYVSDYTPPSGMLPGTAVLRRLEPNGASVRLPVEGGLFVRHGLAFRLVSVEEPLPASDGGFLSSADGGLLLRQRPAAVEAVSLVDGGIVRLADLDGGVLGVAIDRQWLYALIDVEPPTLSVWPLPQLP